MWQAVRVGIWIAIVLARVPASAEAQTLGHSKSVHVRIAAPDEERDQLQRVLIELLQRLSVELVVAEASVPPATASERYVASAFIDLRSSSEAALYVHDPARDRVLERKVARAPGGEELVREELGHILLAAVEALLEGAEVGAPSAEVPEAAAHVVPAPVPEPDPVLQPAPDRDSDTNIHGASWSMRAAILYEVEVLGHGPGVTHGPALAVDVRTPWSRQLGLLFSAQYRFPFEIEPEPVGMRTQAFALRALPVASVPLDDGYGVALRFGLGAGADITRVDPQPSGDDRIRAAESRTLVLAVGRVLAGVDVRLGSAISLWTALAADVDLDRSRYVLQGEDGGESTITEPWRVRPALWLGAALP